MKSEQGQVVLSLHAAPGSLLGVPAIIGPQLYTMSAIAHKGSKVGSEWPLCGIWEPSSFVFRSIRSYHAQRIHSQLREPPF
jgi:hypothetical protein